MPRKISYPLILVNLKSYREALGSRALAIARKALRVSEEYGVSIAIAPQIVDLRDVASTGVPTFAQHVDPVPPGSWTGHVTLEAVKDAGAIGVILNHSERRLRVSDVGRIVDMSRRYGLLTVVCGDMVDTAVALSLLKPTMVAIEPPELIGSGKAVSRVSPHSVAETVRRVRRVAAEVKVLCGAGITSGEDVRAALKLGASGVLLASAVAKAKDPGAKLGELARAVRDFIDRGG